jgi:hypothetical protein
VPQQPQSFENHIQRVPVYTYVAFGAAAANLAWHLYRTAVAFSLEQVIALLAAIALVMALLYARFFALKVQDRVIRLEMRVRLAGLAPDLASRFGEFTMNQLVSLRFAGDAELPDLARKVLSEGLDDRTAIKRQIRDWQGDYWRV